MKITFTKDTILTAAQQLWAYGKDYPVWAFYAGMGVGKTTFISTLCAQVLGVEDAVSSPTFAIINQYKSPVAGNVCHMDWYRLKSEEEAIQAGVEDALTNNDICFIEWPEIAPGLLPEKHLSIYIEPVDDITRIVVTK